MSSKKPAPLFLPLRPRKLCPVCGQPSYSRQGIHPQCAAQSAERKRPKAPPVEPAPKPPVRSSWSKVCPDCGAEVHVRRAVCECGHSFVRDREKTPDD